MNFGFLLFSGLEELDLVGPWEIAALWSKYAQGPERCILVAQRLEPVTCAKGLLLQPHVSFSDCPPLDYLLVPGGEGTRKEVDNPATIEFITKQAQNCRAVLSVCTGSFLLHRSGLLSGRQATTHWASLDRMRALGDVRVLEDRFVRDGNIRTSAGVSAGLDLTLAFIESVAGGETAGKVQAAAEYFPSDKKYGGFYKSEKAPGYLAQQRAAADAATKRPHG